MFRGCVIDFSGSWEEHLPLAEFTYNNNFQSSIQMAPCEALDGQRCHIPFINVGSSNKVISEVVSIGIRLGIEMETENVFKLIQDQLRAASDRHKAYTDMRQKDIKFRVGDQVFLKVSTWKKVLRFGHKRKLSPRRYCSNPSHVIQIKEVKVRPIFSYEEELVKILDHERNHVAKEATWEIEDSMQRQ
ncbi:Retrotransposon protein, Ty3-gypsy subclass [Gossypium australe]|uniref:Retrotransposon protein, Ty3-gypsy subclass n=1 Tax=Gossypium australe TaxID=47621 RepID=A0A5B6VNT6_9ROSI|nr:Retrotransposon protein, Ty3-gypsy subclass [Gossypium australe]